MASSINTMIGDNLDGTYSYNYSVARPGVITIAIFLYTQGGVFNEFFPNQSESGNNAQNGTWTDINLPLATQNVYTGRSTDLSANFYFQFKAPITGIITFKVTVDDNVKMTIGILFELEVP